MRWILTLTALALVGCGGKSTAELMTDTMKKCSGTVSVSITLGTLWNSVTMHCDKLVFKEKAHD